MKKALFWISMLYLPMVALTQPARYDYQWVFGYEALLEEGWGLSVLDFNNGEVTAYAVGEPDIDVGDAASFICDAITGELEFTNNNCSIYDASFNPIEGSEVLIPGYVYDDFCSQGLGYPSRQNTVILPLEDNLYLTFFRNKHIDVANQTAFSDSLYVGNITTTSVQESIFSEKRVIHYDPVILDMLTATPGIGATGWWLFSIGHESNQFVFHQISEGEVNTITAQLIGPELSIKDTNSAQVQFSPNNDLLAINSREGVLLYDFDPANGQLSNFRQITYPGSYYAQGLCFSPNGQMLYVNTFQDSLYQINLATEEVIFIAHVDDVDETNWPIGMGNMHIGPDCRIYISPGSTTYYLHTIHRPNLAGTACQFQARAIETPTRISHVLPYIPNFRAISPCDESIEWTFDPPVSSSVVTTSDQLRLYPNPASRELYLERPEGGETANLQIVNLLGQSLIQARWPRGQRQLRLAIDHLPEGLYNLVGEGNRVAFVVSRQ